jgi:hypothetical protein
MTDDPTAVADPTDETRTAPRDRECLTCYLARRLAACGCNHGLRWTLHWRDRNAPKAENLRRRLMDRGGFCDCEVLSNVFGWTLQQHSARPFTRCAGVLRRGSINPCRPRYPRPADQLPSNKM